MEFNLPTKTPTEVGKVSTETDKKADTPQSVLTLAPVTPTERHPAFYASCKWDITAGAVDGQINAYNGTTGDSYEGSMADFNAMLKGL